MSPFHFVHSGMGIDGAIKINISSFSDIVRIQGSSKDYFRLRCVCNTVCNYVGLIPDIGLYLKWLTVAIWRLMIFIEHIQKVVIENVRILSIEYLYRVNSENNRVSEIADSLKLHFEVIPSALNKRYFFQTFDYRKYL